MQVTLKEIANEAGVSIYTVSRVLNGKVKEAYRPAARRAERIRQVADRLGFVPNAAARTMRRSGTQVVGLLVPRNPFTSLVDYETILGVSEGLESHDYVLALIRSTELAQLPTAAGAATPRRRGAAAPLRTAARHDPPTSRVFHERMLDGMLVLGPTTAAMRQLLDRVTPACLWMNTNEDEATNCLKRDEHHAGRLTATELAQRGYRRFIYISPIYNDALPHHSTFDRARGVTEVAREKGIEVIERTAALTETDVEDVLSPLMGQIAQDTAIVAATDRMAMALLVQIARAGLRPGIDMGIAACDRTRLTQTHWPGLSCVDVRRYDLGVKAAGMMVEILKHPQHTCPTQSVQWGWYEGDTTPAVR